MRDLFLLDNDVTFLNHGSFGACPIPVFDRYQQWQLELERQPVEFLGRRYDDLLRDARDPLAEYVGTEGDNLVFVPNATAGLNMIARSLNLNAGEEILTTDHEYGALNLMWRYISRETGAKIVRQTLPTPMINPHDVIESIWAGVTPRTRVLFLSHITSATAAILPIDELCRRAREVGIITMIDGAHVPGHLDINLNAMDIDFYAGNCHKWLCAPKGAAFVYIHPRFHEIIDPLVISWGWDSETLFERTRWQGTQDIAAYLTVPTAIQFQQNNDWDAVRERCHELVLDTMFRVCEMFGRTPFYMPRYVGQMAIAPLPDCNIETVKSLLYDQHQVEIPLTKHNGKPYLRISMQGYNTRYDADTLLDALGDVLRDKVIWQPYMA